MTAPATVLPEGEAGRRILEQAIGFPLTDQQWEAVSAPLAPAVIVAGAGSGKTTAMAARVAYLIGRGLVAPDQVLGLTFTTKAAAQLLERMRSTVSALAHLGYGAADDNDDEHVPGEPTVQTYHAFAAQILAEHGIRLGREPGARLFTEGARHQLAHRVVCRSTLPLAVTGANPITLTGHLLRLDEELTELAIAPQDLRDADDAFVRELQSWDTLQENGRRMLATARSRAVLADLVVEWRAAKGDRDLLDFADQIRLAGELVQGFPDVAAELRRRFATVLLDEYQDTSIAQRVLLQDLFGDGHAVMAVGDPCQAIYGWRGASVDNIENFPEHFSGADAPAHRYLLTQNRRSGPAILEVANRTSADLRRVHAGVEPLLAGDNGKGPGQVTCGLFDTYVEEVAWVVDQVATLGRGASGARAWRDIAVIAAKYDELMAVDTALRQRGIPTQVIGAAALLSQPAVIELRSMLEVMHDPSANPAFVRLAAGPRWRIGPRDLAALGRRASDLAGGRRRSDQPDIGAALDDAVAGADAVESVSLTEALDDLGDPTRYSAEAIERFAAMARELRVMRGHAGEPLPDLLLRVMRVTGLEVEAALGPSALASQQQEALHAFLDLASEFTELDGRLTLGAFLTRLRDIERFDVSVDLEVSASRDAVQLLTVHKAKGLEFPIVFAPFLSDGAFPGGRARPQWPTSPSTVPWRMRDDVTPDLASFPTGGGTPRKKDYDAYLAVLREYEELEHRRLAYVAFTRAEVALFVSGHWWGLTQKETLGPHAFLSGVREACLDGAGTVAHWADRPEQGVTNPHVRDAARGLAWPAPLDPQVQERTRAVASAVRAVDAVQGALPGLGSGFSGSGLSAVEAAEVHEWDLLTSALLEEEQARHASTRVVALPEALSASLLMRALAEPEAVAQEIVRPMPRPPAPAARRGTQFHAWVETRYGQQSLIDPEDLPGAADADIVSEEELQELQSAFERSSYAQRTPVAVEAPFALVVAGRVVNGRIDAVFASSEPGVAYEVVDWKTGSARHLDPMQLAVYRLAWATRMGVPVDQVGAAFLVVATGEILRPDTSAQVAQLLSL